MKRLADKHTILPCLPVMLVLVMLLQLATAQVARMSADITCNSLAARSPTLIRCVSRLASMMAFKASAGACRRARFCSSVCKMPAQSPECVSLCWYADPLCSRPADSKISLQWDGNLSSCCSRFNWPSAPLQALASALVSVALSATRLHTTAAVTLSH